MVIVSYNESPICYQNLVEEFIKIDVAALLIAWMMGVYIQ